MNQGILKLNEIRDIIQERYTIQNENGTFSMDKIVYNLYPYPIITELQKGMDSVNKSILAGDIKFKMVSQNQKNRLEVLFKKNVLPLENKQNGQELFTYGYNFLHTYCSNYTYTSTGFYCYCNEAGCRVLSDLLGYIVIGVAGGAEATSTIGIGEGLAVAAEYLGLLKKTVGIGSYQGGVTLDAWGSPMGDFILYYALLLN